MQAKFTQAQVRRFLAIFDQYQRTTYATRQQYMDRVELEFRMDPSLNRLDLDELDKFYDHKRWLKQKEKALLRDWHREKQELKEKTVQMIEN